ncbi:DUF2946 family protein [uncultured Xylophilus sp.]|uniref:DUF2946 family protein n=1 Tax=uncultured Xylophilus sp. TaxID=296832 RepID=UPI0025FC410C|nr:DUF2946 family protein [uncultured Xylophilus sp.]
MHVLRTCSLIARLVLVWYALTLGAAIASPIIAPQAMEMVCSSAGGMKMVVNGDATDTDKSYKLDCPLCAGTAVIPAFVQAPVVSPQPLAHAMRPLARAHIAGMVGAPLPPRGPPSRG